MAPRKDPRIRVANRDSMRILPPPRCQPPASWVGFRQLFREGIMYAVIQTGGKQYKVQKGDKIFVEKLIGNVGDAVSFDKVLLVGGGEAALKLGKPHVS